MQRTHTHTHKQTQTHTQTDFTVVFFPSSEQTQQMHHSKSEEELQRSIGDFLQMACSGQHTYLYTQALLKAAMQHPHGAHLKRLSQEMLTHATQRCVECVVVCGVCVVYHVLCIMCCVVCCVLYCVVLYCIVLCCVVLCCVMLRCVVLCCVVLCCVVCVH